MLLKEFNANLKENELMVEHKRLISKYYKDDGGIAKVFQNTEGRADGEHSFYSISYYNPTGTLITKEEFRNNSLSYVEDTAENWTLGIKKLGS